ncbi:hypothetical protein RIVM261_034090 [Rivularia sp. IAM M-261]|nr:hypothetical protein CAL7716_094160 [Calothrix sp. PCC 7716]GJD18453.1 hypothetical protein RIVM261_034090 [Rivularia sp. IAM M-261]
MPKMIEFKTNKNNPNIKVVYITKFVNYLHPIGRRYGDNFSTGS